MAGEADDRERLKEELKEDPLLLITAIYNNIGSLVVVLDKDGRILLYNKVCQEMTGLSLNDARSLYYWDLFCQSEEVELYKEHFLGLRSEDFPFEVEAHHIDAKGKPRIILWKHSALLADNLIKHHVMTGTDVTFHKESDQAIQEMGERYRALIHASPVAVISLDPETRIKSWSSAAEQIFGWSEKEVLERDLLSVLFDRTESIAMYLETVLDKKTIDNIEVSCEGKDGRRLYLDLSLAPLYGYSGEINGIVLVGKDISDRKQIEEDLRRQLQFQKMVSSISSSFVHLSFDRVDDVIYDTLSLIGEFFAMDRIYLYWSSRDSAKERFNQWSIRRGQGINGYPAILALFKSLLEKREILYIPDVASLPYGYPKREELLSQNLLSLLLLPMMRGGQLKGFLGFVHSRIKREWSEEEISLGFVVLEILFSAFTKLDFEEALRSSEEYNRSILELIPDSIVRFSRDGEYLDILTSSQDSHIQPKEDLIGRKVTEALPKREGGRLLESIERAIGTDSLQVTDYSLAAPDGTMWYEARIIPKGNQEVIGLIRNITEKKRTEFKIQESTKRLELQSKELTALYGQLDEEFHKARKIHESALPRFLPKLDNIDIAAYYQPAQKMGGDFYYVTRKGNQLFIYLADVTGHGLDGAMLSLFVKNTISSFLSMVSPEELNVESIMQFLAKQYTKEGFPQEYLLCIYLAILDLENLTLSYLGAGFQDYPLLFLQDDELLELSNTGLPISSIIPRDLMNFKPKEITLKEGSTLLLTTDGLTEQIFHKEIYSGRLKNVFQEFRSLPAEAIAQMINEDFMDYNKGFLQGDDDITFLILQIKDLSLPKYTFHLESSLSSLTDLRRRSQEILKDYQEIGKLLMALHELTANAIEHGNCFHQEKRVKVEILLLEDSLFATIEDEGAGFPWRKVIENSLDLTGQSDRGRGVALTRLFSKRLFYNEKGNKAHLLLSLDS